MVSSILKIFSASLKLRVMKKI